MKLSTLRALHVATDALLVSAGWLVAWGIRSAVAEPIGRAINPLDWYLRALPVVVVPWIATCWWFGIYRSRRTQTAVDELSQIPARPGVDERSAGQRRRLFAPGEIVTMTRRALVEVELLARGRLSDRIDARQRSPGLLRDEGCADH